MNEILMAISLLLAFISVVYGQWIGEINTAIDQEPEHQRADNLKKYKTVRNAYRQKAIPLTMGSAILMLIFLPEFIKEIVNSYHVLVKFGFINAINEYSTMKMAFVAVFIMILYFLIHLIVKTKDLRKNKKRLNPNKE